MSLPESSLLALLFALAYLAMGHVAHLAGKSAMTSMGFTYRKRHAFIAYTWGFLLIPAALLWVIAGAACYALGRMRRPSRAERRSAAPDRPDRID